MKTIKNMTIIGTLLFLTACGGGGDGDSATPSTSNNTDTANSTTFNESLRGKWVYIHNGSEIDLNENFKGAIDIKDSNLLQVSTSSSSHYLLRKGNVSSTVKGSLYKETTTTSPVSRSLRYQNISSMNVVLGNINDSKLKKETSPNSTGTFEFNRVTSGSYFIKAEDEEQKLSVETKVDIYENVVTLGSFKLVSDDGYNFKTDFIIDNSDNGYMYGNFKTYTGKLRIHNIGSEEGTGLNYSFSTDDPYVAKFSTQKVLGSVAVDQSIDVPFEISFNMLDKSSHTVPVNVTINDAFNNTWTDTVFLHVFQESMQINIATESANVKGYIIIPGHNLVPINTSNETILVPYREGENYILVLSSSSIKDETSYSIGINAPVDSFEEFSQTSAHEPNNTEHEAHSIQLGEAIVSFLHKNDIDFFKIDMTSNSDAGSYSPPLPPFQ